MKIIDISKFNDDAIIYINELLNNYFKLEKLNKEKNKEITILTKDVEKYKKRCYESLTLIRKNYGLLDKYEIDILDDILNGTYDGSDKIEKI